MIIFSYVVELFHTFFSEKYIVLPVKSNSRTNDSMNRLFFVSHKHTAWSVLFSESQINYNTSEVQSEKLYEPFYVNIALA